VSVTVRDPGPGQRVGDIRQVARAARDRRGADVELAVVAGARAVRVDVDAERTEVRRHDAQVDVGDSALDRLERRDEVAEVGAQRLLFVLHRVGVVDHEQQIDIAIDLEREVLLLDGLRDRIEARHLAIRAAGERHEGESDDDDDGGHAAHADRCPDPRGVFTEKRTGAAWRPSSRSCRSRTTERRSRP
jgi:hypothetical protein